MTLLSTPRLLLLPLTREVLATRLRQDAFELRLTTPDGPLNVTFPPEWPGEPLGAFPFFLTVLNVNGVLDGSFIAVARDSGRAVGRLGTKGPANAQGEVEIGYGMNPSDGATGMRRKRCGPSARIC